MMNKNITTVFIKQYFGTGTTKCAIESRKPNKNLGITSMDCYKNCRLALLSFS